MIVLSRRSRSLCAIAGAFAASAGLGLVPLYARSSSAASGFDGGQTLAARTSALMREPQLELPPLDDPFARSLPSPSSTAPAARRQNPSVLPRDPRSESKVWAVRAIVSGPFPQALLDDGATTRIVAVGDSLGEARVRAIDPGGVALDDGRRLILPEASR